MRCSLVAAVPPSYLVASDRDRLFSQSERKDIFAKTKREMPTSGNPSESCSTNLFFGFFFDGTKNNYELAELDRSHSNVARLYDCFPGLSVPGVLPKSTDWQATPESFTHFFRVYVPGVASPFDAVNDDGNSALGGATGKFAERRIVWALLQAINNVNRYFNAVPLFDGADCTSLASKIELTAGDLDAMEPQVRFSSTISLHSDSTRYEFEKVLRKLHSAVQVHWLDKSTGRPRKINPGVVKKVYLSVFGFSRGATQARAFTNWLLALCRLDAHLCGKPGALTLGGFEIEFDFLGLFDTVASIGLGNTFGNSKVGNLFDGHSGWADSEKSLRVPTGVRCLHLVAGHEIRRSFPLDSISVGNFAPDKAEEIVFPGVHSDVGCGYAPCEQGRGVSDDGEDMLSRIPLIYMYRAARIAGVPLKLELAPTAAQKKFKISTETIAAFNAYLGACERKTGSLTSIFREQAQLHMRWRLERRISSATALEKSASFNRASTFYKNDLHSANVEFEEEVREFESWLATRGKDFKPVRQPRGFRNEHLSEWEEIATWWNHVPPLPMAVTSFFDHYVHDSRASFKLSPFAQSSEEEMRTHLEKLSQQRKEVAELNAREKKLCDDSQRARSWNFIFKTAERPSYVPVNDGLSDDERRAVDEFDRTRHIPRMLTYGREPFNMEVGATLTPFAGYLRYRKIYGGGDNILLSAVDAQDDAARVSTAA